jgi:hypothetical protein
MGRTPGYLIPSLFADEGELMDRLRQSNENAGFTPFNERLLHSMIIAQDDKPALDADLLIHYGVKGMHWGVRNSDHPGASRRTNREARKDAKEFARAKLFYGEGAGNRRKLIKATVEAKSKKDPTYKAAFDHHLAQQDLSVHAEKARGERRRKDAGAKVGKNARAVNRAINGPFAGPVVATTLLGAYGYAKTSGLDKKVMSAGKSFINNARFGTTVDLGFDFINLNKR